MSTTFAAAEPPVHLVLSARTRATYLRGGDRGAQGEASMSAPTYHSYAQEWRTVSGATLANFFRIKGGLLHRRRVLRKLDKGICSIARCATTACAGSRSEPAGTLAAQQKVDRIDERGVPKGSTLSP